MYQIRDQAGVLRTITGLQIRDSSGVLRTIKTMTVRDQNNILRTVFTNAPAVAASPSFVSGFGNSRGSITISTNATTVTAPSGSTFSWASPDTGWSAIYPTSASTAFRKINVGPGSDFETTFVCTVTSGGVTATVSVTATVENLNDA